ncbi:response regulator [Vibrio viridaestus]|uniref:DNA-binding response regulator n=1 Tax=Vibrio viridaestus TaxID=2487322 RepID=A0A3N9TKF3_9VIBR|nr:response regulator transcription factor [Vibrio viridaestus]RQW64464.1 DNA-binding response regulator [Vibrio viridaestus]
MTQTILVVEDEPQIQTFIRISLEAEGYRYAGAKTLHSAHEQFISVEPDVVILDLGLPDGDGIELLRRIRTNSAVPVLILTARDQEDEKIRLLESGANDYLSKPFGIRELMVRIKVLVRDLVTPQKLDDRLIAGRLALQRSTHQVWLDECEIALTKKEFAFLEYLILDAGKLVLQEKLLENIWGTSHTEDTHYLRILVSQLRKKLADSAEQQELIKTEAGLGYRLII